MAGYIGTKASVVTPGAERKKVFSITTTTTSLTGLVYTPGFVHVFHNGVRLVDGTDYTATNGTSITLTTAAQNGDEVVVISYATFEVADAYTKAESDDRYVNVTGDTMTGALAVNGNLTVDSNTLFVDAANNLVGVGTSSPEGNLHVLNSSAGTVTAPANFPLVLEGTTVAGMSVLTSNTGEGRIWFGDPDDNDVGRIEYAHSTNAMTFRTNATDRMVIDSSGNVGINLTNPGVPLHVKGFNNGNVMIVDATGTAANYIFDVRDDGTSVFRVDPSGNLLVGTTSSGVSKVYAAATGNFHALRGEATTAGYVGVYGGHSVNNSTGYVAYFFNSGSSTGLYMSNTAAWQSISDARMKEDVKDLDTTERLMQLRPVDYLWKHQATSDDPDRRNLGFIAQEIQEVFPELVSTSPDGKLGVEYTGLIAPLVKALQEALTKIDALEARIVTLEGGAA